MGKRVSSIERLGAGIEQWFASDRDFGEVLEEVGQLGTSGVSSSSRSALDPRWALSSKETTRTLLQRLRSLINPEPAPADSYIVRRPPPRSGVAAVCVPILAMLVLAP